jgi:hypothetical protein
VVIVTQHLNHVIFTFSARSATDASSAFTFEDDLSGGGFLAPPAAKGRLVMRLLMICVVAVSATAVGCSRSDTAAAPGNALVAPVSADAGRDANRVAVATAGRTDAPSPAAATVREVTIPAGTTLSVVLDTTVGSDTSRIEEPVTAHLSRGVNVHGETVIAEGSRVSGVVTDATRSGKVKGRAHVAVRFNSLTPRGADERYTIHTAAIGRTAAATKQKDALEIGAPAAGGAIIGAIVGGKKGALIGGAAGGGAGTAVVMSTRGKEVHLAKGAAVTLRLSQPVTVRVRG